MYRIIVVDDEAAITDWLYQAVSEEFNGVLEVYRAYCGEECLELMAKGGFHIVMTDISMPAFSGLDLLSVLKEYYPKTKKLILSAYDNFSYAKEAIELGVSAYILKGDGDDVLFAALHKVVDELEKEQEAFQSSEREKTQPLQSEDVVRHKILRHYLRGAKIDGSLNDQVYPRWIDFELPMDFALITLEVHDALQRRFQMMALEDSLAEYLKPHYRYEMIEMGISEVLLLVQPSAEEEEGEVLSKIRPSLYAVYENAQSSFYSVTQQYLNIIYSAEPVSCTGLVQKYELLKRLMKGNSNFECSIILSEKSADRNMQTDLSSIKREIAMVVKYIEENTDKDLSLIMLADVVYLNPSYLSHLFRQQMKMTISEYIKDVRIGQCKKMLADPKYHIHEVARAVGYDNASYFTRFFKKMTGMTPQAYRQGLTIE
ncbi:MAG: helix-turn-helix domain-containing protein [Lachnospiraceae bacterium]|nr:helix-turn-helix domain-containing protein [Lachnospiraceae bacterium]